MLKIMSFYIAEIISSQFHLGLIKQFGTNCYLAEYGPASRKLLIYIFLGRKINFCSYQTSCVKKCHK